MLLAARIPSWWVRIVVLAGVYTAVMLVVTLAIPAWHDWDWRFFSLLSSRAAPVFSQDLTIVDVAWDPKISGIPADRLRVASFLNGLVKTGLGQTHQWPDGVILDFRFYPCHSQPCTLDERNARDALVTSIRTATYYFPVYATEQFPVDVAYDQAAGPLDPQDQAIYAAVSGAADTIFISNTRESGLFYRRCYSQVPVVSGDIQAYEDVWSMVARVLMLPTRGGATLPACDPTEVALRLGPKIALAAPTVYRFTNASAFQNYPQLDGTYVIVGTIEYDRSPYADRSGPELLGWALSNARDQGLMDYYDVQPQNRFLLLLIPVFSALAVLVYAATFFLLKRTRLRAARHLLPALSSVIALALGLGIFLLFEFWMFSSHHIQPQVSLISIGIVVASGLGFVRGSQVLNDERNAIEPLPVEAYDYDVFVSYAREDGAWVYEHVYVPLRDATLSNGEKLSVFFDTSAIRGGSDWQSKITLSLDASRFVVPVYSETYFTKPYCRFEIMRAHRKWINAGIESRCVFPVMLGHPKIYEPVSDIQARSIDDDPNVVQEYIAEIVDRLSHGPVT
ncbi:MAG TPA: toll/interleukin-1 receptor domain-containing protein [Candidatus Baltobacteraceae bacterium]|nr:toll/interleukin-1 receptor domain-containing protein [Candidatus Baltobacteraceae bacterium]